MYGVSLFYYLKQMNISCFLTSILHRCVAAHLSDGTLLIPHLVEGHRGQGDNGTQGKQPANGDSPARVDVFAVCHWRVDDNAEQQDELKPENPN